MGNGGREQPSTILADLPEGARVLVIRLRSLGDMVLLTPALESLKTWRPDLRLSVLAEPSFAAVLEGNPAVEEVVVGKAFRSTAARLFRRRFPVTFNQHGGPTSTWLTIAAASPERVCWQRCRQGFLYTRLTPRADEFFEGRPYHTVEERLTQFWWTGMPRGPIPATRVFPRAESLAAVEERLAGLGVKTPFAVIHPAANYPTKTWPAARFVAAARWLERERGLGSLFVLGPGDGETAAALAGVLDTHDVVLDDLGLSQLIALMSRAAFFLGNDSGPAHVAAAAGTPAVVVFGSSNAERWRPWGVPGRVVRNPLPCSPCRGRSCVRQSPHCILSIGVEQVTEACASLLDETGRGA